MAFHLGKVQKLFYIVFDEICCCFGRNVSSLATHFNCWSFFFFEARCWTLIFCSGHRLYIGFKSLTSIEALLPVFSDARQSWHWTWGLGHCPVGNSRQRVVFSSKFLNDIVQNSYIIRNNFLAIAAKFTVNLDEKHPRIIINPPAGILCVFFDKKVSFLLTIAYEYLKKFFRVY